MVTIRKRSSYSSTFSYSAVLMNSFNLNCSCITVSTCFLPGIGPCSFLRFVERPAVIGTLTACFKSDCSYMGVDEVSRVFWVTVSVFTFESLCLNMFYIFDMYVFSFFYFAFAATCVTIMLCKCVSAFAGCASKSTRVSFGIGWH
jgi:hypothetical protein